MGARDQKAGPQQIYLSLTSPYVHGRTQVSLGKIRRKSCIDMSKEVASSEKKAGPAKDKGWSLDGKTPPPNRRASISVFKPLS